MMLLLKLAKEYDWKLVFLDEAVFTFNTFNTRAWASKYHSVEVKESSIRVKTQALVAAISEDAGLESYLITPRSITADSFIQFLKQLSDKQEKQPFALFMDNLSVHKTKKVMKVYEELNIFPIFNIPYSPDYNGIESYFALVKGKYKKLLLSRLIKEETINAVQLIKDSILFIEDSKVINCVRNGLKCINVQA